MAYLEQQQDDEEKKGQQPQMQAPGTGGTVAAGTGGVGAGPRQTRRGGFVGLQQYMQAQGDAGARLGQQLSQDVTKEAQEAITGIQQAGTQFGEQAKGVADISGQIAQDPTQVTSEQYQQATGGYKGPMGLADVGGYQGALKEYGEAQQQLGQLGSAAGQEALLRRKYGSPQYTRGLSSLDMALMGAAKPAQQRFQQLRNLYGEGGQQDLAQQLQTAEQTAQTRGQELFTQGQERSQAAKDAVQAARDQLNTDVRDAATAATEQRTGRYNALRDAIQSGDVSAYKDLFGGASKLDAATKAAALAGLKSTGGVSAEQAMTAQQASRDAALARLLGSDQLFGTKERMQGGGNQGFTFDRSGYDTAVSNRAQEIAGQTAKDTAYLTDFKRSANAIEQGRQNTANNEAAQADLASRVAARRQKVKDDAKKQAQSSRSRVGDASQQDKARYEKEAKSGWGRGLRASDTLSKKKKSPKDAPKKFKAKSAGSTSVKKPAKKSSWGRW